MNCAQVVRSALREWMTAPPSEYREGGDEFARLVLEDMEENECECLEDD